jgi:hypothetical protein
MFVSYIVSTMKREKRETMTQITRTEAEALFTTQKVISSNIEQDKKEMRIFLTLSDHSNFMIKYDLIDHVKRYFVNLTKK